MTYTCSCFQSPLAEPHPVKSKNPTCNTPQLSMGHINALCMRSLAENTVYGKDIHILYAFVEDALHNQAKKCDRSWVPCQNFLLGHPCPPQAVFLGKVTLNTYCCESVIPQLPKNLILGSISTILERSFPRIATNHMSSIQGRGEAFARVCIRYPERRLHFIFITASIENVDFITSGQELYWS